MTRDDQWQLEGSAAELYERYAARYILGPWAPGLVDIASVQPGERVLDLACGTGAVARIAAERVGASGRVTGLDLNRGMLDVARSLPPPSGAPIEWIEKSALDTGLAAASFDVVLCQQGLQFFPDPVAALRESRRVLAEGGRIAMSVWRTVGVYNAAVGDALRAHAGREVASRFCASRDVPDAATLADVTARAGFKDVAVRAVGMTVRLPPPQEFVIRHLAATPVAAAVSALPAATLEALGKHVARSLDAYRDGAGVAFREEIHVVTARA